VTSDLLVVQHYPGGVPGLIEEVAHERDRSVHIIRLFGGDTVPKDAEDAWAVVVLGGPMAAWEDEKHPHLPQEVELLKRCIEADTPTLGVCLGAQLVARAAGARNFKGGMPEIGWYPLDLTAHGKRDPLFAGLPAQPKFFFWHEDAFDLPPEAERLASTRLYPNSAFRLGKRVYGVAFHPEKTDAIIEAQLTERAADLAKYQGVIDPARIRREMAVLGTKRCEHARQLLVNFLESANL
jgi:GMP synthase (glutamine-hydrolysing)